MAAVNGPNDWGKLHTLELDMIPGGVAAPGPDHQPNDYLHAVDTGVVRDC
jgi:hypothetical protein